MTEDEMTLQIQQWEQHRDSQQHEVAAKFLCEARSHLRNGKEVLAKRKTAAAFLIVEGTQ